MTSARSAGLICGHGPLSNASRAAATARSTSAVVASGTLAMTSSVWGEITASWSEPGRVDPVAADEELVLVHLFSFVASWNRSPQTA